MNNYYDAWLLLIFQRDQVYFYLLIAAAGGLMWYRFCFYRWFVGVWLAWLAVIGAALGWGVTQLGG